METKRLALAWEAGSRWRAAIQVDGEIVWASRGTYASMGTALGIATARLRWMAREVVTM